MMMMMSTHKDRSIHQQQWEGSLRDTRNVLRPTLAQWYPWSR
jgi:hypothetical protein